MNMNRKGMDQQAPEEAGEPEVEQLRNELSREREMRLRALADFQNYRKRVERERESAARAGKREIVLSLLDLMDDFDRAIAHADESRESVLEGVRAIRRRLESLLEAQGVTPIESLGQPFDPALHEAVGTIESDDQESGAVLDEVGRGYRWGDELLRPTRVFVAK